MSDLEFLDADLDGLYVRAEVQSPLLLQLFFCLVQPAADAVQVRVELLPLLHVLLHAHLFTESLSLQQLPALDHTCTTQHNKLLLSASGLPRIATSINNNNKNYYIKYQIFYATHIIYTPLFFSMAYILPVLVVMRSFKIAWLSIIFFLYLKFVTLSCWG